MCETPPIKPRAILRADAGLSIGYGHFVRTCALACYMAEDFDCVIFSRNPAGGELSHFQRSLIGEAGFIACRENNDGDIDIYNDWFLNQIRPGDLVVLDNYFYTTDYMRRVRERCRALVCIDDMHDRHFPADAVITFCPLQRSDFSLEPYTRFRSGIEWSFLRPPFLHPTSDVVRDAKRIVVAMGGADPLGLTQRILGILAERHPDMHVDVIAGDTVKVSPRAGLTIHRGADAAEIVNLFDRAALGIFPASTICVEALSRRLPIAAGYFVDNQEEIYADGVSRGWFIPLGSLQDSADRLASRIDKAIQVVNQGEHTTPCIDFNKTRSELLKMLHDCMR